MREIKFRCWDKEFKRMKVTGMGIKGGILDGENVEIMQFTGLRDRDGREIYEGDIIEDHNGIGVIEFDKWACFSVVYKSPIDLIGRAKWFHDYSLTGERESIEVIGNIYETPELLEAKP